ncbi:MAG: hypothetical protein PHV18_14915 [Lachnospiraceae bacterium]|nr:hypothetical protein [Lachnospiraceae bacterium]
MEDIYIEAVTITPNPVDAGARFKVEVEIYTLYPAENLYPAISLYPGEDLFTLCPATDIYPENNLYPTEGGIEL